MTEKTRGEFWGILNLEVWGIGGDDVGIIQSTKEPKDLKVCIRARAHLGSLKYPTVGSPFSHSLRAICTVLLDPRDPLL